MSEGRQETSVIQVVFDSGMGAFSQGMQDMAISRVKCNVELIRPFPIPWPSLPLACPSRASDAAVH